ncbi:transglycosylase SLT domain-containing protein [Xenophilus sp. Marseille-Q4582]|uniref:transglycosylase SLT domain-containing protein n=1 Tax=Xenophilus sp. Marseille-Q4582 TaxID=2866600 RepID=UPI001CE3BC9D|nr:transglycosylase SLT domain-containing protein [Xenophilus sp. Marseille-Q4582]
MAKGWGFALQSAVDGYMRGQRIVDAQADREYQLQQRQRLTKEQAEADALKQGLKDAAQPVQVQETGGPNQLPDWADSRDAGSAEMQALPNAGLVDKPVGFSVAGQTYADRAAADGAATKANAPEAVAARAAQVYRQHGQLDKAAALESNQRQAELQKMQIEETARTLKKNGVMDALAQFRATGDAASATKALAGAGFQIDGEVSVAPVELDVPGLGKIKTYEASFGMKDGDKVVPIKLNAHQATMAMMPYEQVMAQQARAAETGRQQANADRSFYEGVRQFNISNDRANRTADRQDRLADTQIKTAELALSEAQNNAKIPAAVKTRVDGLRKEADTIGAAIVKAQAEGSWSAEAPGARQLLERRAVITEQINQALAPYMPEKKGEDDDPFLLRKGGAPGKAIPFNSPAWDGAEAAAAKKVGVPAEVLRTIRTVGERSNGDQVSPKGARGVYQFIPATREAFQKKYGVDAYSDDPNEQALAAAYHLKESFDRTGSWDKAMAGYNGGISGERGTNPTAENRNYSARTSAALAAAATAADPMEAVYRKQVDELNKGTRVDLSSDVKDWMRRRDDDKKQRFSAAQAAYLQQEKERAQRESKALAAQARS